MEIKNDSQLNDIQSKYNKLRDMIILGEQEVVNLKRAKIAEQSEIQRLIKYAESLRQDIKKHNEESLEITGDIVKHKEEYKQIKDDVSVLKEENQKLSVIKVDLKADIDGFHDESNALQEKIGKEQIKFNNLKKEYNDKRSTVEKFIEKATEALKITLIVFILPITLIFGGFQLYERVVDANIAQSKE